MYIYYCTREKKIDNARGEKLVLPFPVGLCRYVALIFTSISSQDTQTLDAYKRNHDITISLADCTTGCSGCCCTLRDMCTFCFANSRSTSLLQFLHHHLHSHHWSLARDTHYTVRAHPVARWYKLLVEHMFARCPLLLLMLWVPLALRVSCKENKYNYLVSRYFIFCLLHGFPLAPIQDGMHRFASIDVNM